MIAGAGPAAAAAAIALAGQGVGPIAIAGPSRPLPAFGETPLFSETLPGAARIMLHELGVWQAFTADRHPPCLGSVSQWGSDRVEVRDALTDPQGAGWRLDRDRFERMLLDAASRRGVIVLPGRAVGVQGEAGDWRVRLQPGGEVRCRTVVDAAGRRAPIARRLDIGKSRLDRLTAHITFSPAAVSRWDGFSQVRALETGWAYATRLPNGSRLHALFTDADLPAPEGPALRRAAWTGRLGQFAGPGWAAVGDAACSFDPLSSQGLFHALYGGLRLGCAVAEGRLHVYADEIESVWAAYERHRRAYYGAERRWPAAAFWKRRSPGSGHGSDCKSHPLHV